MTEEVDVRLVQSFPKNPNVGFGVVSKEYLTRYADELIYSYDKDYSSTGAIRADVKFKNTFDIQGKLEKIIDESGFSNVGDSPNYISSNANWAYLGGEGVDISSITAIILSCLLIIVAGYLIIYNVFQISIIRDIRFYGLLNTIFTISKGFDLDKYLEKFVDTDFLIADAQYFNYNYFGVDESVSESMISAVKSRNEFAKGGRLYSNSMDKEYFTIEDKNNNEERYNKDEHGNFLTELYGMEDFPMSRLQVLEGEIDLEKLSTGKYIIEGVQVDDNGNPNWETSHFDIGDKVVLHNNKGVEEDINDREYTTSEFIVMAKVSVNYYTNSVRRGSRYSFYLPAQVYKNLVARPGIMSYVFDVEDGREPEMELFLKDYTENIEGLMHYESKQVYVDLFEDMKVMVITVGLILSGIMGTIGIVNFINSVLTSIFAREREFAILQSIGMTKRQLITMLIFEGGYYSALTIIASLILGIAFSIGIVGTIVSKLWFFTYSFTVKPLLIISPILVLISIIIPTIVYNSIGKKSVVERLRNIK